jgi:phosphatidylserine/phosphatidylglycerophosphate/cardiolipin synthase-like enzyme
MLWINMNTRFAAIARKLFFVLILGGIFSGCAWLFVSATSPPLPDAQEPLIFYSNQTRQDIKLIFCKALSRARRSIYLMMYGITDPDILSILKKKITDGVESKIHYDKSASVNLRKKLPASANAVPFPSKGLMHRKILVVDDSSVFLGSANFTTASLKHHDNLVIGIFCPPLAACLTGEAEAMFPFEVAGQQVELWLLPDRGKTKPALHKLIAEIAHAQHSIELAIFTLTHPALTEALIDAHHRGVRVKVALDLYTARGASRHMVKRLESAQIPLFYSRGQELLHHKWALIDQKTLVVGSANWTQAAFAKNEDFLLYLYNLDQNQKKFISKLWRTIELESL